ncbi:MAG: hypothetical protein CMN78_00785 [Spirochaetales bacterium]|nr:hypothetical protein [Spirochaetales bacterium]
MKYNKYGGWSAAQGIVCFAGSRRGKVNENACCALVQSFQRLGFSFLVGCAHGVDQCFRQALSDLIPAELWTVHCAFQSRVQAFKKAGSPAICRVTDAPSPGAALHRRTVTMISESSFLVLFPDDPATGAWGRGSRLAFGTAVQRHKPVFVVAAIAPSSTKQLRVTAGSLFGVVSGSWVAPLGVPVQEEAVDV